MLPAVRNCLVCEIFRTEEEGKSSLFGFFGVTPDVSIGLKELGKPAALVFVFLLGTGSGRHRVRMEIIGPDGDTLGSSQDESVEFRADMMHRIAVQATATYEEAGEYSVRLLLEDQVGYESSFKIRDARIGQ